MQDFKNLFSHIKSGSGLPLAQGLHAAMALHLYLWESPSNPHSYHTCRHRGAEQKSSLPSVTLYSFDAGAAGGSGKKISETLLSTFPYISLGKTMSHADFPEPNHWLAKIIKIIVAAVKQL